MISNLEDAAPVMRLAVAREILRQGTHVDAVRVTGGFQSFLQLSLRDGRSGAAFIVDLKRRIAGASAGIVVSVHATGKA